MVDVAYVARVCPQVHSGCWIDSLSHPYFGLFTKLSCPLVGIWWEIFSLCFMLIYLHAEAMHLVDISTCHLYACEQL